MNALQYNFPLKSQDPVKIALFSDIHIDSPDSDHKSLVSHLNYCQKNGHWILVGGDLFDSILRTDNKRAVNHLLEDGDNQLNIKLEQAYNILSPYQEQILFLGRGNHEESCLKYNGIDLLQMLSTMLNSGKKHKIDVGNYSNFLRMSFNCKNGHSRAHYDIYQTHGMGASAPVTKGMIDFNRIANGVNADLIWVGHKHQAIIDSSAPMMYVNTQGNVVLKNRQCIMTPSYQKGRTIDPNVNFAERMYTHTALSGFGEVELKPVRDENGNYSVISDLRLNTIPMQMLGQVKTR